MLIDRFVRALSQAYTRTFEVRSCGTVDVKHLPHLFVSVTLLGSLSGPAWADVRDLCSDRSVNGTLECMYRPHIIEPFRYSATGPYETTTFYLDEQAAKDEMGALIAARCSGCCDAGRLVSESAWRNSGSGPSLAWKPDIEGGALKDLTYSFSRSCQTPQTVSSLLAKSRNAFCEKGWTHQYLADETLCTRPVRNQECLVGHPIALPSLAKVFREEDYASPASPALRFVRHYRSDGYSYPRQFTGNLWLGLGSPWTHNYSGAIVATPQSVWIMWGAARPQHFQLDSGSTFPRLLSPLRMSQQARLVEFSPGSFGYYTPDNELVLFHGGLPTAVVQATGRTVNVSYGPLGIAAAQDASGRRLEFGYDEMGHVTSLTDPSGATIHYDHKPPRLDGRGFGGDNTAFTSLFRVRFQDGRSVEYRSPDWDHLTTATTSWATRITSVIDELSAEYKRIIYSSDGTVLSSELAGGVGRHSIVNGGVSDPLGAVRRYAFLSAADGSAAPSAVYQPAGSGCAASNTNIAYDSNGNVASREDFNQQRICYVNDLSRNLEAMRVEGLAGGTTCSTVTAGGAALPAGSRKISTQWHPDWRLPTRLAEPSRITTSVYNGQPDSFAGGAVASCAPADALLPDGKPIAVLCRQVVQATTDTNGSQGFSATLQAGVADSEHKWTYNRWGQVLTHDGPRADVNDVTTYAYYSDISFTGSGAEAVGHTQGDLQSVTNAAGQVTQYTKYNKHGQLLESIGPNGVVTTHTYDLRQRLLSTTEAGQTTTYTYDAAGQLTRITWPDASYLGYEYDPAHRQTAVFDHLGNRIEYTLDNAGNRIAENVKDPGGLLSRQLSRSLDALGRVQQTTGRE